MNKIIAAIIFVGATLLTNTVAAEKLVVTIDNTDSIDDIIIHVFNARHEEVGRAIFLRDDEFDKSRTFHVNTDRYYLGVTINPPTGTIPTIFSKECKRLTKDETSYIAAQYPQDFQWTKPDCITPEPQIPGQ